VGGHDRDSIQKRAPAPLGCFIPICVEWWDRNWDKG